MKQIKPIVKSLFMAERSAASVENNADSMGLAFHPYGDMDVLLSLPLVTFEALFTSNYKGSNRKADLRSAFLDMDDFNDFWRIYGNNIIWRKDDG